MTSYDEINPTAFRELWRQADALDGDSLITEDEADAFVADTLSTQEEKRVLRLLRETPAHHDALIECRRRFAAETWSESDAAPDESGRRDHDPVVAFHERTHSATPELALSALTVDDRVLTLGQQVGEFLLCRDKRAALRFFARLIHPVTGIWQRFCRAVGAGTVEGPKREAVLAFVEDVSTRHKDLGCGSAWRDAAVLMHDCAADQAGQGRRDAAPPQKMWGSHRSQMVIAGEYCSWLFPKELEKKEPVHVQLPVVLCEVGARLAHTATLRIELLENGTGSFTPAPCMALVPLDGEFKSSLDLARKAAREIGAWSDKHDLRWSLTPPEGMDVSMLMGGSLGAAVRYGVTHVMVMAEAGQVADPLASRIRDVVHPESVCFACELGNAPADGILAKVRAALEDPRIKVLICRTRVRDIITAEFGPPTPHAPNTWLLTTPRNHEAKLSLVLADTLDEAIEAVVVEQKLSFRVFDWRGKNRQAAKVERDWIVKWIHHFIERTGERIGLITGQMGSGKTSFLTMLVDGLVAAKNPPIAHFIDRGNHGSDDPKLFMQSLCAQVCRKHRLPFPTPPAKLRAWSDNDMLAAAQQLVASLLNAHDKTSQPEVLYIDALDEAFEEGARFHLDGAGSIPDLLRAIDDMDPEWKSVRIVATSRDAAIEGISHLANLRVNPDSVLNLGDTAHTAFVKRDLMDFFIKRLGCDEATAEAAAVAANGSFLFARLRLKQSDADGINELLDHCIADGSVILAERSGISVPAAGTELIKALGVMGVARVPLTGAMLEELLGKSRRDQILTAIGVLPEFFEDGALKGGEREVRWLHSYIAEFIVTGAKEGTKSPRLREVLQGADATAGGSAFCAWHAEIGAACLGWRELSGASASYAVRHLLAHLRHARLWDKFAMTVTDVEFLRARLQQSAGCRDLVKSLQRALKKERKDTQSLAQRPLMKMIFDVLVGLSDADSGDWLHVFQELFNQLPEEVPLNFLGAIEAVLDEDGRERVWLRVTDGAERKKIAHVPLHHPCAVVSVAFSRERAFGGQWLLVTACVDRMVRIWKTYPPRLAKEPIDPSPTKLSGTMSRLGLPPTGVAFVKSKHHNLVTLWNGVRFIYADFKRSQLPSEITASVDTTGAPHSLAVPSDCALPLVAAGYSDGTIHVFDADHPKTHLARLVAINPLGMEHGNARPLTNTYGCIAISPDGRRIAVALPDQHVRIWSLDLDAYAAVRGDDMWAALDSPREDDMSVPESARGVLKGRIIWELPPSVDRRVDSLAWSPDGTILAIGGGYDRGVVELWDVEERTCTLFNAHQNSVWALAWLQDTTLDEEDGDSPSSALETSDRSKWILISGSYDRTFALWSYDSIINAAEIPGEHWDRKGYADNQEVSFEFINRHTPAPLAVRAHSDVVLSIAVAPDQSLIATAGGDHEASVWAVEDLLEAAKQTVSPDVTFHGNVIHGASISPDGGALVTASEDGVLRFWDMHSKPTAKPIQFDRAAKAAQTVKFSPVGLPRAVLVGTQGAGAYLCELNEDLTERGRRHLDGGSVTSVAFNPKADATHQLAIGHDSGVVTVHEVREGGPTLTCPINHSAPVRCVVFSPDGSVLVSVGNDKIVIVWDLVSGACFKLMECHQGRIKSAAFSPDGKWLATGGRETIRIWNTDNWTLEDTIQAHNNEIWTLEWSPCGNLLASGAKDRTVRLWNMARNHQGSRKIASLPCSNSVVAIWFSADSMTLHVADPGPERRKPGCTSVEIRGHATALETAKAEGPITN